MVQEVCVATAVTMMCGSDSMSWDELSSGYLIALGAGGMLMGIGDASWIGCCAVLYQLKTAFDEMRQQQLESGDPGTPTGILPDDRHV